MKITIKKRNLIWTFILICFTFASVVATLTIVKTTSGVMGEDEFLSQEEIVQKKDLTQTEIQSVLMLSDGGRSSNIGIIFGTDTATLSVKDLTSVKYIANANYFSTNPWHHDNNTNTGLNVAGVCTTVSLQMLMGYHNYYSDRRIIPTTGNSRTFLDANYGKLEGNPVFQRGITDGQGCQQIGTTNDFFHELYEAMLWPDFPALGQAIGFVKDTGIEFMENHTPQAVRKNISLTSGLFSASTARADIDAGRPIVLGMHPFNNEGSFHVIPAYGYAKLDDVDGFLVHYGYGDDATQVWVPESWFGFQIQMSVDHTHNLIDTCVDLNNTHRQLECTTCGYSTVDNLYNISGSTITDIRYPLTKSIVIPKSIEIYSEKTASFTTHSITTIGSGAFANQLDITNVVIPSSITSIESKAFANCSSLVSINLPNSLTSIANEVFSGCNALINITIPNSLNNIGEKAFAGCNNLNITVLSDNPNYSSIGNILYNKDKTKIISSGKIDANITVLDSVVEIMPYAFKGNINLNTLRYGSQNPVIGKFAFNECNNLNAVYFDSYNRPQMGELAFPSNNFALYTPYISRTSYGDIFADYTTNLQSETFNLKLTVDGNTETKSVYYGADIVELVTPLKTGHTFAGWYDNINYSGNVYSNSGAWETKNDIALYAKFAPNKYNIYFKGNGVNNIEPKEVVYGNEVGILPQVEREGYTFLGWEADNGQVYTSTTVWQNMNDIILTAEWSANEYVISLDTVGGVGNGQNSIVVNFGSSFSTINIPTKAGYVFEGWFDSQNIKYITVNGEATRLWNQPKNTILYAQWQIKSYEIQINGNGGITWLGASGLSNVECSIKYGTQIDAINLIYVFKNSSHGFKDGNIFDHFEYEQKNLDWSTIPDLGDNGAIITITPIWIKEKNVIYFNTQCDINVNLVEALYDSAINLPTTINRGGYDFRGWYNAEKGGDRIEWNTMPDLTPNEQNNGSITLYAQYNVINYSITYVLDGGNNSSNNPSIYIVESIINFEDATKYGYDFEGWYLDENRTVQTPNLRYEFGDKTLYAKWSNKVIEVALDRQGGSGGNDRVSATYGLSMPSAFAPSRKGYTFKGYYSQANGVGTQYYNSSMNSINNYNNIYLTSLFAYWEANKYEVTLNYSHTAISGRKTITVTYDAPMPTIEVPTYWAITFEGYYTDENGSGAKYYNYAGNSLINWDIDRATTLYANWIGNLGMVEPDNFSSGGLSKTFTEWNTYIDFSLPHSSGYVPLNYDLLKNIGHSKVQFGFGGMFKVYGKVIVEVRCYNKTKNKQIGEAQSFTSKDGVDADLAFNFETNLSEVNNGDEVVIQMRYRKAHIWGGDFKIVAPKLYTVQTF